MQGHDFIEDFFLDRREVQFLESLDVSFGNIDVELVQFLDVTTCLLYTSPSPRD